MFDEYYINNLIIGNRVTIYNVGGEAGITTLTDGPYIFYKVPSEEGKKQKYKEIFTEEVFNFETLIDLREWQPKNILPIFVTENVSKFDKSIDINDVQWPKAYFIFVNKGVLKLVKSIDVNELHP